MFIHADNDLIFDSTDDRCRLVILQLTGDTLKPNSDPRNLENWIAGTKVAFVSCYDQSTQVVKQYCGLYNDDKREESIEEIMLRGSKFDKVLRMFGETNE